MDVRIRPSFESGLRTFRPTAAALNISTPAADPNVALPTSMPQSVLCRFCTLGWDSHGGSNFFLFKAVVVLVECGTVYRPHRWSLQAETKMFVFYLVEKTWHKILGFSCRKKALSWSKTER